VAFLAQPIEAANAHALVDWAGVGHVVDTKRASVRVPVVKVAHVGVGMGKPLVPMRV
jgi:hypothetical protein